MSNAGARFEFRNREVASARLPVRRVTMFLALASMAMIASIPRADAQSAPRPEQLIKWRQSAFQVIAWNSSRIKAELAGKFERAEVQRAAVALSAVANSGLAALFVAGTEQGTGWRGSTVKPAAFGDASKFRALSEEFAHEAESLSRIAANGDRDSVKDQFLKVAQTCKRCHDQYRSTD